MRVLKLYTISRVAEIHGTTHTTVRRAIDAGEIVAVEIESATGKRPALAITEREMKKWKGPLAHGVNRKYRS